MGAIVTPAASGGERVSGNGHVDPRAPGVRAQVEAGGVRSPRTAGGRVAKPATTEDRAFQILGLVWAGGNKDTVRTAACGLIAEQRPNGGWAQHASLASDAYATGQALVALHEAGAVAIKDEAYQRGVKFLVSTQLEDGSWYVRSRSIPFQPYFESGFPHGPDQWISVAATNWAATALAPAAR